jgi:hypothetical protein
MGSEYFFNASPATDRERQKSTLTPAQTDPDD